MSLRLVSDPSSRTSFFKRAATGALLVGLGYVAALVVPILAGLPGGASLGVATSSSRDPALPPPRLLVSPRRALTAASEPQAAFDYFPDHYRNQATEPAEQLPTF
jgi:hypothetical protein